MKKTFLFYDIETSGLNPAFDQVLTFASIRTDLELNEINRNTITICLRKDIIPSPKAFLTHGLTYDQLELGITEYKAAQKIHKILNRPGTISLGYNSLKFDDEFLRFLFYRNLLDPYSHQYSNGCCRMDILPITIIFKLFSPDSLKWPKIEGKSSLKLELISKENSFKISGRAHEAMSDVEAVIELAKKMFVKKDIWTYCLCFFDKFKDEARINKIKQDFQVNKKSFKICLMLSTFFGSDNNYMAPVLLIGQSKAYKNQSLWLRLDLDDIPGLIHRNDINKSFVVRKRSSDELIVLPVLERFFKKISSSSKEIFKKNLKKISHHRQNFFEFIKYHQEYKYPFIPDLDFDAALYQEGFFSVQEKTQISFFHKSLKNLKPEFLEYEILDKINSPRVKALANRILYRNFKNKKWQTDEIEISLGLDNLKSSLKKDQIIGYKNDTKFNLKQGFEELQEVEQEINLDEHSPDEHSPDKRSKKMLFWLKNYMKNL